MKSSNPARTNNAATKSNRPAIHTAASGLVPWMANRAAAKNAASREAHSQVASVNTNSTFTMCSVNAIECHAIGLTPAHIEVSISEMLPIGRKNPSPPGVANNGRMAKWDVLAIFTRMKSSDKKYNRRVRQNAAVVNPINAVITATLHQPDGPCWGVSRLSVLRSEEHTSEL